MLVAELWQRDVLLEIELRSSVLWWEPCVEDKHASAL